MAQVTASHPVAHHFTVDVEEHYQVSAFEPYLSRDEWGRMESRVAASVDRLLRLLEEHGARGTFFILGCVAEQHPEVVAAIARGGHEVASHGWDHRRVTQQTPAEFRESVRRTKAALEAMTGRPVLGFRAPSYSIVAGREWALDILAEEGYRYDSSLFPVRRPGYGYAAGGRQPYWLDRPAVVQERHRHDEMAEGQALHAHQRQHASELAGAVPDREVGALVAQHAPDDGSPAVEMEMRPATRRPDERIPLLGGAREALDGHGHCAALTRPGARPRSRGRSPARSR